jgi:hypothetical protein
MRCHWTICQLTICLLAKCNGQDICGFIEVTLQLKLGEWKRSKLGEWERDRGGSKVRLGKVRLG